MMFIYLFVIILIIFILRILFTKKDYDDIKRIKSEFEKYLKNDKSPAPNSYEFKQLFDKMPNVSDMIIPMREGGRFVNASLVSSFPSKEDYLSVKQLIYLDAMSDYFQYQYKRNFNFVFWLKFYVFLPKQIVKWLGLKPNTITEKLLTLIYWIIGGMFFILKPILVNLMNHLLR